MVLSFPSFCAVFIAYHPAVLEMVAYAQSGESIQAQFEMLVLIHERLTRELLFDYQWVTACCQRFKNFERSSRRSSVEGIMGMFLLVRNANL